MIHDSVPWKSRLIGDADLIERWAAKPSRSERRSFLIEQKVFLAAYAMRKLDDATKLSTSTLSAPMRVQRFAPVRSGYSEVNSHRFDKFFDLSTATPVDMPNRRLVNLLIHSLVFVEVIGEAETFDAFMVTSDYEQAKGLIQVELADFTGLMRSVADDYPSLIRRTRDKTTGQWRTWAGHEDPSFGET
ncbi:hypothetical protein [Brevundimonas goettingensis]|uniref:Uncharacterized protein n=1 Tax=Brevundimonas goettingensis TaxID=2774190 RepID=A0A975C3C6_9CAUL|nr:hypothetical protein [Brevundimonas goettingensis]QTC90817.1 hypothetical protein IFJ75_16510 [Brevundimonas goettingensis]